MKKRRSPRRHKVLTRHPRYDVSQYGRGTEGHSGEKLRGKLKTSKLKGHDPEYYEVIEYPSGYEFIGAKPYLSGRRTLTYSWSKIMVDDAKWKAMLKKHGFTKVASAPDGGKIIYVNPRGMYVVTSRQHIGEGASWDKGYSGRKLNDLGSVRFEAHPNRSDELIDMVHEFRGAGKVSGFDTSYKRGEKKMLVWSKDGETQPDRLDSKPLSVQKKELKRNIKSWEAMEPSRKKSFRLASLRWKLKKVEGLRN